MDAEELRRLALLGARARLVEIEDERVRLIAAFPELARGKPRGPIAKPVEPVVMFDAATKRQRKGATASKVAIRKYPSEMKAKAIELLRSGVYPAEVQRQLGIKSAGVIYNWIKEAKIKHKTATKDQHRERVAEGKARERGKRKRVTPEMREALLARVDNGETARAAGRALGMPPTTASKIIAKARSEKKGEE